MKILLVNPPFSRLLGRFENTEVITPIGLPGVAAYINKHGYGVSVYDANRLPGSRTRLGKKATEMVDGNHNYLETLNSERHPVWGEIRERLIAEKPDVVGISVLSSARGSAFQVARICKEVDPRIRVVFGGYHPTGFPEDVLSNENVDVVVRGEGEQTFLELLEVYKNEGDIGSVLGISYSDNGNVINNPDRAFIDDMDSLPFTADFVFQGLIGRIPIQYGRGCPYGCKFCADRVVWKRKIRYRSAENVVEEIESAVRNLGVREFTFIDGTFNVSRRKVMDFCELVIEKKLDIIWDALVRADKLDDEMLAKCRRAGCVQMNLGVESGSERVIDDLNKAIDLSTVKDDIDRIKKHGISVVTFFCIGMPPETAEDLRKTRDLISRLNHDFVILSVFTPLPGTDYYLELLEKNIIGKGHDFDLYGFKSPRNHFALNIADEEFEYWRNEILKATDEVNKKGRFAVKMLLKNSGFFIRNPRQLIRRAKQFAGMQK
ncbi:MAG TPA: radical SAM protein [bacterium]|nr:radical SAM protein [bacterium]